MRGCRVRGLLRLVPLLGRLARGADPRAEEGDALGITPQRPRHELLRAAARAYLGRLTGLHLVREPRDLGLHARDYTLSSAGADRLRGPARLQPDLRHRLLGLAHRPRGHRPGHPGAGAPHDRLADPGAAGPGGAWSRPLSREDHWRLALIGVVGFTGAFALGNWGLARSTASNAALLITVEPTALILLSPLVLGERLTRREGLGAALAILGAAVIVVNGIPGVTPVPGAPLARATSLLILSGAGLRVLLADRPAPCSRRHPALVVTAWSIVWGAAAMVPVAAAGVGRRGPVHAGRPVGHRRRALPGRGHDRAGLRGLELVPGARGGAARGHLPQHPAAGRRAARGVVAGRAAHRRSRWPAGS